MCSTIWQQQQQWLYSVVVVQSHYHQSVFLLSEDMSVSAGADLLRVTGRTRDGYIIIQIDMRQLMEHKMIEC